MSDLLQCQGVVCRLGDHVVLQEANLEVGTGEAVGLIGGSGSGKSTLLRIIAGLEIPEQGEVKIAGETATAGGRLLIPPHRRGVSMLFQDLALWPNLTVEGNVCLGLSGLALSNVELGQRVQQVLELCGIGELARRRPGTLSGGQQQRVALARSLAMHPKLLLLDEPLGGLDLLTKDIVLREIARLKAELGFGLILVTHDPVEVRALCDSLAVLEGGRIAERASLEQIVQDAQTPLAKALVGALGTRA